MRPICHGRRADYHTRIECSLLRAQVRRGLITVFDAAKAMAARAVSLQSAVRMLATRSRRHTSRFKRTATRYFE